MLAFLFGRLYLAYSRRVPQHRGRTAMGRMVARTFGSFVAKTPFGPNMRINVSDSMSASMLESTCLSAALVGLLDTLGPGQTVVDVGANAGLVTLMASLNVGSDGLVLAFEPNPQQFSELAANVRLNDRRNVALFSAAVGERPELRRFASFSGHSGISRFTTIGESNIEHACELLVPVVDGDFISKMLNGRRIDLLKIDVEGAELLVLQGLSPLLARVDTMVVEVTPDFLARFGHTKEQLYQFLTHAGFTATIQGESWQYDELFRRTSAS